MTAFGDVADRLSLFTLKQRGLEAAVAALVEEAGDEKQARGVAYLAECLAGELELISDELQAALTTSRQQA